MNDLDVARLRLYNQAITSANGTTPQEVVRRLGAVQAQDYANALWALGLRVNGATRQTIEQALRDRAIIRTWPLRGTLHFVTADDARWMLKLLTPRVLAQSARRRKQLELDDATLARAEALFAAALRDSRPRTREEMMEVLEQGGISTDNQRKYHLLWWAAQRGVICFGPRRGKQDTFVLLDEWVPDSKILPRDEALAELTLRYFTGHGPATIPDYMWWSGLTAADARTGLAMVEQQLEHIEHNGQAYWFAPSPSLPDAATGAHLLPGFDEYLLGYRDRQAVLDPAHAGKVVPGGNGVFRRIIVVDGRVVGIWQRTLRKTKVLVTFNPFELLSPAQQEAAQAAAEPYGRFLGLPVELSA